MWVLPDVGRHDPQPATLHQESKLWVPHIWPVLPDGGSHNPQPATLHQESKCWVPHIWPVLPDVGSHNPQPATLHQESKRWVPHIWPVLPDVGRHNPQPATLHQESKCWVPHIWPALPDVGRHDPNRQLFTRNQNAGCPISGRFCQIWEGTTPTGNSSPPVILKLGYVRKAADIGLPLLFCSFSRQPALREYGMLKEVSDEDTRPKQKHVCQVDRPRDGDWAQRSPDCIYEADFALLHGVSRQSYPRHATLTNASSPEAMVQQAMVHLV
jgi:hypothetical protein